MCTRPILFLNSKSLCMRPQAYWWSEWKRKTGCKLEIRKRKRRWNWKWSSHHLTIRSGLCFWQISQAPLTFYFQPKLQEILVIQLLSLPYSKERHILGQHMSRKRKWQPWPPACFQLADPSGLHTCTVYPKMPLHLENRKWYSFGVTLWVLT